MTTTMEAAFAAAGYGPTEEKLRRLMREAITAGNRRADPSRDHFIAALTRQPDAAELLWLLFEPVRARRIGEFFTEVLREMRGKFAGTEVAMVVPEGLTPHASDPGKADAAAGAVSAGLPSGVRNPIVAPPPQPEWSPPELQHTPPPPAKEPTRPDRSASAQVLKKSILDRFEINRVPLRNIDLGEARRWLKKQDGDNWFLHLLIDRLPYENGAVGDYVSEEEAERIYARVSGTMPNDTGGAGAELVVPKGQADRAPAAGPPGEHANA
jgi:hypothetical protein